MSKGYIIRVKDKDVFRLYATTLLYTGYREPEPSLDLAGPKGDPYQNDMQKAKPSTGASSSAGVRAINHAHDFAVGEVMPAPKQTVQSARGHLVHGSKLVKDINEQQLDQEAKLLCHCRPSKYLQSRTCEVLRAWCHLHQPCGMPVCTNEGEQSAPANSTCNFGRLVSQLLHAVLPDSCCEVVVMSASKIWRSRDLPSALQGPGWLLGIGPSYGGELWVQLQLGDKVQGNVNDGQLIAGQTISLQEGVPVEIKDETQWCATLSAAAEGSLFLFAALQSASPGTIHALEAAAMKALVDPSSASLCSRDSAASERTGDVPRQGESTSSFRVGESSLGPDKPEKSDEAAENT